MKSCSNFQTMASDMNRRGTASSTPWAAPPAFVKHKGGGGGQAAVSNDGYSPDVLRGGQNRRGVVRLRVATWNIGSMSRRSGEVVDAMVRRGVDMCCVQESRWKGGSARWLGRRGERYKFFWMGTDDGSGGVGMLLAERWVDEVMAVQRVSERILLVKLLVGRRVVNIISAYGHRSGGHRKRKIFSGIRWLG